MALATCRQLPVPDPDRPLLDRALTDRGVDAGWVAWDDPGADWSRYDAVWIRSTWNYTEDHSGFLDWVAHVASHAELLNPPSVVAWNSHKSYLLDLQARGVDVVPTVLIRSGDVLELDSVMDEMDWSEAVVKPAVSVGAIGAERVPREAAQGWPRATDRGDLLVQPMMPGVALGETSMIAVEGEVTHAVRKIPAGGEFRVQVEYGGEEVAHVPTEAELALASRALAEVGERLLYARVDCVDTPDGPRLMELELIEPSLFLPLAPAGTPGALADALLARLR